MLSIHRLVFETVSGLLKFKAHEVHLFVIGCTIYILVTHKNVHMDKHGETLLYLIKSKIYSQYKNCVKLSENDVSLSLDFAAIKSALSIIAPDSYMM
jgi:hypothetical protein